ncbi:DNA-directed RNA polymerase subunit epsilon [Peribacillus sp. FSL H8-0477]|uniref:DNA-dependent RNA polymerase subunit epsilon n=1 Tax=Peribacillus sp. FSL H8-0477 TaxID=2921388 RepID=UPI0030F6E3B0
MIFKVYYQETLKEVAVREHTHTIYVEADSIREARFKIKDKPFNVEYVEPVTGAYYEYEKQNNPDFKVLELG